MLDSKKTSQVTSRVKVEVNLLQKAKLSIAKQSIIIRENNAKKKYSPIARIQALSREWFKKPAKTSVRVTPNSSVSILLAPH